MQEQLAAAEEKSEQVRKSSNKRRSTARTRMQRAPSGSDIVLDVSRGHQPDVREGWRLVRRTDRWSVLRA